MSEFSNFEPISRDTYTLILDCIAKNQIYIWDENALLGRMCWLKLIVNILAVVSHVAGVIEKMSQGADLVQLSNELSATLILCQASLLHIQFCVNKKLIKNLIINLDSKWRTDDQLRPEMIAIKHESVQSFYKWVSLFNKCLFCFSHAYLLSRLVYVAICHLILRRDVVFIMTFHIKMPFQYDNDFILYCLVYLADSFIFLNVAYLVTSDLLLMNAAMRDLRLLFVILQHDLKNIAQPGEDIDHGTAERRLKAIIPQHQDLLQLMIQLSEAFGAVFFIHLAFFSGTMCFFGFAARINCNAESIQNLPAVAIILISIYTCCTSGQHLTDASMDIAEAAYDSQWQLMSHEYKKYILFIILRSQTAQYIKSTSFTDVSLTTFTKILNVTWSFLSLITKVYEE
uniref:Odorant receptor n=1 Tax=Hedya nubiferana TaxID=572853 RepID=A0A223HD47_9NEOP|nr:putative odorant receptor OR72 [Hedya nubiferana]